jgi:hypothetical protein
MQFVITQKDSRHNNSVHVVRPDASPGRPISINSFRSAPPWRKRNNWARRDASDASRFATTHTRTHAGHARTRRHVHIRTRLLVQTCASHTILALPMGKES